MYDSGEIQGPNCYASFLEAIEQNLLPASVPVEEIDSGRFGMATQGFNPHANSESRAMAFAPESSIRALAAVMVCSDVRKTIIHRDNFSVR